MTVTRLEIRPRYEGANVGTWIGFKHLNYLVEEAVLEHLRRSGIRATDLYHDHGLCVDLVDIDTRILSALRIDDLATAEVTVAEPGTLTFSVVIRPNADPGAPKAVSAKVKVSLRHDPRGGAGEIPAELRPYTVARLGEQDKSVQVPDGADPLDVLTGGRNAFAWKWRIPYFYCHFTERMQMSGYLRIMEEVVDLFLADRGVSVKRLLDEQGWIPAVPHSRVTLLDEALMEEELYTVLTVEDVFKRLTYTSRMDCYVLRDGLLVPTATGRITHGYAEISGRSEWGLVSFDDRLSAALSGASR
ncbi:thioesterase family protein [Streptosporangium sp. NPDC020072]|uniref:thioesterase family protein n=1 Tax=Streptosporangium sp. NPDC020072 TaxID=3154788 RepID=UPI00343A1ABC